MLVEKILRRLGKYYSGVVVEIMESLVGDLVETSVYYIYIYIYRLVDVLKEWLVDISVCGLMYGLVVSLAESYI